MSETKQKINEIVQKHLSGYEVEVSRYADAVYDRLKHKADELLTYVGNADEGSIESSVKGELREVNRQIISFAESANRTARDEHDMLASVAFLRVLEAILKDVYGTWKYEVRCRM